MTGLSKLSISALLTMGLLTGCAGTPKAYQYQENSSYAYNVARAAGVGPIQDVKLPSDLDPEQLKRLEDGAALAKMLGGSFEAAFLGGAAAGSVSMPGIGSGGALAFGVLGLMNRPIGPAASEMNTIAAWMPASMAATPEDAHKKMAQIFDDGIHKMAASEGFELVLNEGTKSNPDFTAYWLMDEAKGCSAEHTDLDELRKSACFIAAIAYPPRLTPTPVGVTSHAEEMSYGFTYSIRTRGSSISLVRALISETAQVSEAMILTRLSENLPEWVNLYLGTKRTNTQGGKPIPFPYVLNQGQAHLFIKPQ